MMEEFGGKHDRYLARHRSGIGEVERRPRIRKSKPCLFDHLLEDLGVSG